jgi:hypothetical protein
MRRLSARADDNDDYDRHAGDHDNDNNHRTGSRSCGSRSRPDFAGLNPVHGGTAGRQPEAGKLRCP